MAGQGGWSASAAGIAGFLVLQGADASLGLAWACLIAGAALALWRDEIDLSRAPDTLEWALLAFLLAALAASFLGLDPRRSFALSMPLLAALPLWFLLARSECRPAAPLLVAAALGLAALTQIALVAFAALYDHGAAPGSWVRSAGAAWLVVPNDLAWIACLLPFAATAAPRWLYVLAAAAALALALWLHSWTLCLATLMAVIAQAALRRGVKLFSLRLLLPLLAAALLLLVLAVPFMPSMQARWQLWQAALQVFLDHPLGVGLHNFVLAYRESSTVPVDALVDPRRTPWPHSLPLEVLAELGAAGLLALLALAETIRRRAASLRCKDDSLHSAIAAALLVIAAVAATEASLLRLWTWMLATLLLGLLALQSTAVSPQGRQ
ncbi:hypothetical protein DFR29_12561 [Tahibacter aquaticus]|uniref:O-antigen ligase-related domain-containing protein n=1 Tax=Tahibacter aquaticus TaxID=520092 RepID=A0A4R6YK42_9GAMM|nr:O-antigen ligase family protein [Tahibacter aquaticus]TDR37398.1 hypothetical protein DFR29_12561 [Tahibacter aquaticus]